MSDFIIITTNFGRQEDADHFAASVVEKKLAACVQVQGPVSSTYTWQGKMETCVEWRLLIKTKAALYGAVEAAILEVHPFEIPEIIAIPISTGSAPYLDWMTKALK